MVVSVCDGVTHMRERSMKLKRTKSVSKECIATFKKVQENERIREKPIIDIV